MYYKLDLANRKITTLADDALREHAGQLNNNHFRSISLSDIKSFIGHKNPLPENSFLILLSESYSSLLRKSLPVFIKKNISIIIFLPVTIFSNNNKYLRKQAQELNEFIFSDEFKDIFCFTQPNR